MTISEVVEMTREFKVAFLSQRYRNEFAMTAIPAPVRQFIFPAMVGMGHLLGKYKRYADAPEPVRRDR